MKLIRKERGGLLLDIESIRKQLNITQNDMAQELGISKRSYINKIDGETSWTINELIKISKLCNDDIIVKVGLDTYSFKITNVSKQT